MKIDPPLIRVFESARIKRVLDLGAGKGQCALYASSRGAKVDALDSAEFPPELTGNLNINLINKRVEEWKGEEGKYDLVILRNVLHYLPPALAYSRILPEIVISLAEGGFLYIVVPSPVEDRLYAYGPDKIRESLKRLNLCFEQEIIYEKGELADKKIFAWHMVFQKNRIVPHEEKVIEKCSLDFSNVRIEK